MTEPSFVRLIESGELESRVAEATARLEECRLCPRRCGARRLDGEEGLCRTGRRARVASHGAHFGEEAPLVGSDGSGTIFFSSCNLLCTFCQNGEISHGNEGQELEAAELAAAMLSLAYRGCHNINLVTPSHVVPQILEAVLIAGRAGLRLPIVYNTGGYDDPETLRLLEGVVDIYMPDLKFLDPARGERFCRAPDYGEWARRALREMRRQVGDLQIDRRGIAQRGLLVRHLVLPGDPDDTRQVMEFIARELSVDTYVNVMCQYHPRESAGEDAPYDRTLRPDEYARALAAARDTGLRRLDDGV